jgi:tRNA pseudouridine synthase 10
MESMFNLPFSEVTAEHISEKILQMLEGVKFSTFALGVSCRPEEKEKIKKGLQMEIIRGVTEQGKKYSQESFDVYVLVDLLKNKISAEISPVYVAGRYNKFERNIAQTIHYCFHCKGRGCRECDFKGTTGIDSVQEIIARIAEKYFEAPGNKFHGSGREDVDVLMLGNGRPFVVELLQPKKRSADLKAIENEVNVDKRIKISELKFCEKKYVEQTKKGENSKIYSATVVCTGKIDGKILSKIPLNKKIEILQTTPRRSEKSRAMLERKKNAEIKSVKLLDEDSFGIEILASSGLYIKEFISGDGQRTKPSVSEMIGVECRCKQLDVMNIVENI